MATRFEENVIASLARIEAHMEGQAKQLADHEQRIRRNERWRHAIPAAVLAVLANVGLATR